MRSPPCPPAHPTCPPCLYAIVSSNEPSHPAAGIPLQAHVEEPRRCCEAVARLQGGSTYSLEELGIFRAYAEESGLYLADEPADLSRPPDDEGNEHQVWFHTDSQTYLKATWPDFFGLRVVHRPHEEPKASPIAYLERWHLHNELFGDEVTFLGALQSSSGLLHRGDRHSERGRHGAQEPRRRSPAETPCR